MATNDIEGAVRIAGALIGGGLALGGGAIGAAVGDGGHDGEFSFTGCSRLCFKQDADIGETSYRPIAQGWAFFAQVLLDPALDQHLRVNIFTNGQLRKDLVIAP